MSHAPSAPTPEQPDTSSVGFEHRVSSPSRYRDVENDAPAEDGPPFSTRASTSLDPCSKPTESDHVPEPAPGWTPDRIRFFLEQLARSGNVVAACGKLGISRQAAYHLKRRMPAFALAWDGAILRHRDALVDACMERALHGAVEEVVVDGRIVERLKPDGATLRFMMARADRMAESRERHDRPARLAEAHLEDLMDMIDPPPIEGDEGGAARDPEARRHEARAARDLLDRIAESAMPDWDPRLPVPDPGDPALEARMLTEEEREALTYGRWHRALMAMPPELVDVSDLDPAEALDRWTERDWDRAFRTGLAARVDFGAAAEDGAADQGGECVKQV